MSRSSLRLVSLFVSIATTTALLTVGPAAHAHGRVSADVFTPGDVNTSVVGGAPSGDFGHGDGRGHEVVDLRTRDSQTFVTTSGDYETDIYPGPVNFRDSHGRYQPIDNSIVSDSASGYAFRNKANDYMVHLPPVASGAPTRVEDNGSWLSLALDGARASTGNAGGRRVVYNDALPNADVQAIAENSQFKENIVLNGPNAGNHFSYRLNTSNDLTPRVADGGGVDFVTDSGVTLFSIPQPLVQDASGTEEGIAPPTAWELANGPGGPRQLSITIDKTWLDSPARQFPVTIDPTVTTINAQKDCFLVNKDKAAQSFCGQTNLAVGYNSTGSYTKRALLRFDMGQTDASGKQLFPDNAEVLNAQLGLYLQSTTTANKPQVLLKRVIPTSEQPSVPAWTTSATWNSPNNTASLWNTAGGGGDYDATDSYDGPDPAKSTVDLSLGYKYWWYPTALVRDWIAKGKDFNNGIMIKEANDLGTSPVNQILQFSSLENATSSQWPKLTVTWDQGGLGQQRSYAMESRKLSDRMQLKVNDGAGNLLVQNQDLHITGTGLDLEVDRYYNNLLQTTGLAGSGTLGNGWTLSVGADVGLQVYGDGSIGYFAPSGVRLPFTKQSFNDPGFTQPPGIDADLKKNANGTYTLTFHKTEERYVFSSGGYLIWDVDKNAWSTDASGNPSPAEGAGALHFTYNADNTLASVVDSHNRVTTFSYTSGRLTQITDPAGRTYRYGYDASNSNLTSYTDPSGNVTSYGYETGTNQLNTITTPKGDQVTLSYFANRQIASIKQITDSSSGAGDTTTFSYATPPAGLTDAAGNPVNPCCRTIVTDPRAHATTYDYDHQSRVVLITDAQGNKTGLKYNSDANVDTYTNAKKGSFDFNYDSSNEDVTNVTGLQASSQSTDPVNATVVRTNDPAHPHFPTCTLDAQNHETYFTYNAPGDLVSVKQGATTSSATDGTDCSVAPDSWVSEYRYGYNSDGMVTSATSGNGNLTTLHYYPGTDPAGQRHMLSSIDYPGGQRGPTSYTYDSLSRLASATDGKGQTTYFHYDALDRLTQVCYLQDCPTTADFITYGYDPDGNLTSRIDATGTTTFHYDNKNQLYERDNPDGSSETFGYDQAGNLTSIKDSTLGVNQQTTIYHYDEVNVLDQVTEPDNSKVTTFKHNALYQRNEADFPNGVTWTETYNDTGQGTGIKASITGQTAPLVDLTYSYTNGSMATDLVQKVTDNKQSVDTIYTYDKLNRLQEANTQNGTDYRYDYDADSNMTARTEGTAATRHYDYNQVDELTCSHTTATCDTSDSATTTFSYDANGNEVSSSSGYSFAYNDRDQTTAITSPANPATTMTYADANQTERVSKGAKSYHYDILGVASEKNGVDTTYYTRDEHAKPIDERVPDGSGGYSHYYYLPDVLGSVVAVTDGAGNKVGSSNYKYDPYGRMVNDPLAGTGVSNPWRFAGGFYDPETQLYKFGTRYYDPTIARWTQQDPQRGNISDPLTLNPYQYAGCDPVNNMDATGTSICDVASALNPVSSLFGLASTIGTGLSLKLLASFGPATDAAALAGTAGTLLSAIGIAAFVVDVGCELSD